jgi:hypothetical protein
MDPELVEVLSRGEELLERAHEVEEKTRELLRDCGPAERHGRGSAAPTDAVRRSPVRPARRSTSH